MEIVRFDVKSERKRRLVDAELTSVRMYDGFQYEAFSKDQTHFYGCAHHHRWQNRGGRMGLGPPTFLPKYRKCK